MGTIGDDHRPPSHADDVRPASSPADEAGPAAAPVWMELPDDEAPRRRRWVLGAAVLPWIVLLVLVVRTPEDELAPLAPDPLTSPSPRAVAGDQPAPGATVAPTGTASAPPVDSPPPGVDWSTIDISALPGSRTALGLADVAAAALPVVRAWLGAANPLTVEGIESRGWGFVEHAVVEAVDYPGDGAAVASVLTIVLPTDGEVWLDARVLRVAVPLRLVSGEVLAAGEPWLLPPPRLASEPFDEQLVQANEELERAAHLELAEMYGPDIALHGLYRTSSWPLVADVTLTDPLDGQPRRQRIWLRASATGVPIAGWLANAPTRFADSQPARTEPDPRATPAADRTPSPTPTEDPR